MTEYSTSSEAYRTYLSSRDRTNRWLEDLDGVEFHSPGVSPVRLYTESEEGDEQKRSSLTTIQSSHSIPPRLYLRYADGRPNEPIPLMYNSTQKHAPSKQHSRPSERELAQQQQYSSSRPHHSRRVTNEELYEPEFIRVLPSNSGSGSRSRPTHTRSRSLPRDAYGEGAPMSSHAIPPPLPAHRIISQPIHPPANSAPQRISPRSSSQAQAELRGRNPPSIVYAPSGHSARQPRYQPPLIYSHPPTVGPNGVVYSHSAPSKQQQTTPSATTRGPPQAVQSSRDGAVRPRAKSESRSKSGAKSFDESRSRSRSRGAVYAEGSTPTASTPSLASDDSGSTYYVLPTGKQKIHVIRTPDVSFQENAGHPRSIQRNVSSPKSAGPKRSFFQRLNPFSGKQSYHDPSPSPEQMASNKRSVLYRNRRHSTGMAGRNGIPVR